MMKSFDILSTEQIIQSENLYLKNNPGADLVYNSALSILNFIDEKFNKKKILFFCGPGNNGNDARKVFAIGSKKNTLKLLDISKNKYRKEIDKCDIIVDAIFGFGLNRKLSDKISKLILEINKSKKKIISIDIPTGVIANTGKFLDIAIEADITLVLGFFKPCHFLNPGKSKSGQLELLDLKYELPKNRIPNIKVLNSELFDTHILKKKINIHKYNKGSILVIGGEMAGASRIVAFSARKIGAGLATIKIKKKQLIDYAGSEPGTIINYSRNIDLNKYDLIVIGPGLGKKSSYLNIIKILKDFKKTIILDADALSIFKKKTQVLFSILRKRSNTVLTPHEGEFNRLFERTENGKIFETLKAAKETNSIIVFKGNDTVIATPEGDIFVNYEAEPSLATAGTGDMLCGMIGGLVCQGMDIKNSILCSTFIQNKLSQNKNNTIVEDFIHNIPKYCDWLK